MSNMLARPDSRARRNAIVVGLLAAVLAFVGVVQVRSQAEVVRSLEGQDNTQLAFLIDDLHTANERLAAEAASLAAQRDALTANPGPATDAQLSEEATRLKIVEGLTPVHGPGVVIVIDSSQSLSPLDLQDAVNNLRAGGAEALGVNDRRVIASTVFRQAGDGLSIDGITIHTPYTFAAIGEPVRLGQVADLMTRSLRGDNRVKAARYISEADLVIRSTVAQRPFVYGST